MLQKGDLRSGLGTSNIFFALLMEYISLYAGHDNENTTNLCFGY